MSESIYEGAKITVNATLETESKTKRSLEGKLVTLTFNRSGQDEENKLPKVDKDVRIAPMKSGKVKCNYTAPDMPANMRTYNIKVDAEYEGHRGDQKHSIAEAEWDVFPKIFNVVAKGEDGQAFNGFPFTAMQGSAKLKPPSTDEQGKAVFWLKKNADKVELAGVSPYEIVKDPDKEEKGRPLKLRERNLVVRRNFDPQFVKPKPAAGNAYHKQMVNLTTAANGQDLKGHEVTIEVGVVGGSKKGDVIYIQVKFDRASKRNSPEPKIEAGLDAADIVKVDADGKEYKAKVTIPGKNRTAKFKIELGQAGGDKCEIRISSVKDNFAGPKVPLLKFENWRQLYYQMSVPEGASAPNLSRMTSALADVNVVFTKYKDVTFRKNQGPAGNAIHWFDGEWLNEAGKKFLNLGDYNKAWFHAKFVDDKSPLGVHVACCHTQYDTGGGLVSTWASVTASGPDKIKWSDNSIVNGRELFSGYALFPKSLNDGTNSFVSGTWQEDGGAAHGALTAADVWIKPGNLWSYFVKLPAPAASCVNSGAGKKVKLVNVKVAVVKGPYLGEADGTNKWLQLIVIKQGGNPLNDVMAHELGHTLNQVTKAIPPGLNAADHGRHYIANGHQGDHCADGMSSTNYANGAGSGPNYQGNFKGKKECTCIMYGENGDGSTCTGKYCNRCKPFLKAEAMTTLH